MLNRPYETWDHLLMLLGEMQVVFKKFLSLLREEERLLVGMDRQGVADITEKKEQVIPAENWEDCSFRSNPNPVMRRISASHSRFLKDQLMPWIFLGWRRTFARILPVRPNCLMFERTEFNRSNRHWLRGVSWRRQVSWLTRLLGRRFSTPWVPNLLE